MCDAPINIIKKEADVCSLKCLLWYKYGNSSCSIKNISSQLVITYDGVSDVLYNSVPYTPIEIRIFKPSVHTFDGAYADAEIVVVHKGTIGGLVICIPVITSPTTVASTGINLLNDIITNSPINNESTSLNIQDFNLNYIIPKNPYYSYTGSLFYGECNPDIRYKYVVFPKNEGIALSQSTMDHLGDLIHDSYISVYEGTCFFNKKGTTSNGFSGDGQIYIDCQPTGEEGEVVYQETSFAPVNYDWLYALFYIICGIIIMYYSIKLIKYFIKTIPNFIAKPLNSKTLTV